ncbi:hypothetical protein PRIPAC_89289 [Pristionchus pacificus]|uniref:Uncharacterized protein n=1 Tax=Pristionchus pacificus TaxID=54126 RepID=A0A2A6B9M9_PRIPA|nr:hypothetical protein PRIPAC_89289 [Pristionchus pacificus]|eukprot:PDM62576.1 hypothetical protein PRIPAC_52018 [Pristionchus pacificus]
MAPLDRWMAMYLGPPSGRRGCVHCLRERHRSRLYRRGELVAHIEKDHPSAFHEQMRNHDSSSTKSSDGATLAKGVMTAEVATSPTPVTTTSAPLPSHLGQVWQFAGGVASSTLFPTAAPAAVAAPPSLTLCDPPLPADEAYLRGRTVQRSDRESCPRCRYDSSDGKDGRRNHYIRHHYNVFYMNDRGKKRTPLDRWMDVHFGHVVQGDD